MREILIEIIACYYRLSVCLEGCLFKIELCILEIKKYQKEEGRDMVPKSHLPVSGMSTFLSLS